MRIEIANHKVFLKLLKKKLEIHPLWLRERARLDNLHDKNTDQRLYDPSELNANLKIKKASISNGHLNINFNDGIKFDYELYKLFRRLVMLLFIIFEIVAQAYLVFTLYKLKDKIQSYINFKFLLAKRILVTLLIIVAVISIPIVSLEGNKAIKHALEWDYFLGVIFFYCLTFFMWKKN